MSDAEQDAIVGRMVRELAEAKRNAAVLQAEMARLGVELKTLSFSLRAGSDPQAMVESARRTIAALGKYALSHRPVLIEEYAEASANVKRMEASLRDLGIGKD